MKQAAAALRRPAAIPSSVPIKVGVDLGTAFTVIVVTDEAGRPLAAANVFADVVRDGVVWDFTGAQQVVRGLKHRLEEATGRELTRGSVTIPPAVTTSDHRAHRYVVEGAGIDCTAVIDETTAANAVLGITDGAVVDIGGGTTGVAILKGGEIVANIDEPTGGTHLSLVIAGAHKIPFEKAEKRKRSPKWQAELLPVVRPTLEKVATIVGRAIAGHEVDTIHLVGGTAAFPGIADIMTDITGVPSSVAPQPMLVTPLGVAGWAEPITSKGGR
ncbi:MAG: ethanolamine utilization protein EutJ [Tessaracoccus sp.]|nr:ethanolamine utilization protein EutJ [Tessaracoccus sp.]